MRHGIILVLVGLSVSSVMRLGAHHAIGRFYDEHRTITIEGPVGRVLHKAPHPLVHLAVEDDWGSTRTWAVELDAAKAVADPAGALGCGVFVPGAFGLSRV